MKNSAEHELDAQRNLLRKPSRRIAGLAIAGALGVAIAVPGMHVFAEGVGSTKGDDAKKPASEQDVKSGESKAAGDYTKNQVVYTKLDGDGNKTGVFVVNSFSAPKGSTIEDAGVYDKVVNLSTTKKLADKNGHVAVEGQGEQDFVYQGDLSKDTQLPWNVSVSYKLDGKDVTAEELGGKSGKLSMKLTVAPNPEYKGTGEYTDNYLVQVTGMLKDSECHKVDAEGATAAANGSNTQLTYMVLPGSTAEYTVNADVEDFEFDGWQIVGVPLSLALDVDSSDMDTSQLNELEDGIAAANDGAGLVKDGAATLSEALGVANNGAGQLMAGANAAADGVTKLADGSAQVNDGAGQVAAGAGALADGSTTLDGGASQVAAGAGTLAQGTASLMSQLPTLTGGTQALAQGTGALVGGVKQLDGGLATLQEGAKQLQGGVTQLTDQQAGAPALAAGAKELERGLNELTAQNKALTGGAQGVAAGAAALAQGINDGLSKETIDQIGGLANQGAQLQQAVDKLHGLKEQAEKKGDAELAQGIGEVAGAISAGLQSAPKPDVINGLVEQLNGLKDSANKLDAGAAGLNAGVKGYTDGASIAAAGAKGVAGGAEQLADGISQLAAGVNGTGTAANPGLVNGVNALREAVSGTGSSANPTLLQGAMKVDAGAQALAAGGNALAGGAKALNDGAQQLAGGSAAVANGAHDLKAGAHALASGSATLAGGAGQLNDGLQFLNSQTPALKGGAATLADGLSQINAGGKTLADGAVQLKNGTQELTDRTRDLDTQVIDTVKDQIQDMLNPQFTPTDFVNGEQGTQIGRVQFVYMTGAISK